MEKPEIRRPKSTKKSPRSISPNNVVIDGQIIDKKSSENLTFSKKMLLDNILEESDPDYQTAEKPSVPLEDTVMKADKNVRQFIQEMSSIKNIGENAEQFETICNNSQEELSSLSKFLSTIDNSSKNKIIETLIEVYKNEILSGIKGNIPDEPKKRAPQDKISKFKNVCKGLINEYRNKTSSNSIGANNEEVSKNPSVASQYDRFDRIAVNVTEARANLRSQNDDGSTKYKADNAKNENQREIQPSQLMNKKPDSAIHDLSQEAVSSKPQVNDGKAALNLHTNFMVNYHTKLELGDTSSQSNSQNQESSLENLIDSNLEPLRLPSEVEKFNRFENPFRSDVFGKGENNHVPAISKKQIKLQDAKKIFANLPLEIRHSKEQAINRILGRKQNAPIAQTEYLLRNYQEFPPSEQNIKTKQRSVTFYHKSKRLIEDPQFPNLKQLISEGIQVSLSSHKRPRKTRKNLRNQNLDYVKPYKYRYESSYESQSDLALNCPFGCHLNLKKSKSDTDIKDMRAYEKKMRKTVESKRERKQLLSKMDLKEKESSLIKIERKSSLELIKFKDIRRKNQLISYLDKDLRRGDSEFQFSQILFERDNKNMENDLSTLEIPAVEQKQIDAFNANYLLHSLKIENQSKTDILPKGPIQYFGNSTSELSITDEDYKTWLKKQNWAKYSNTAHELKSLDELRSVSETIPPGKIKDSCGEYGYYLDRADYTPNSSTGESSTILSELSEAFLYEHVVISRAINFFLTFNATRTRTLNKWDRSIQIIFFVLFYSIWIICSKYVFVEPTPKKGVILWK